MLTAQGWDGTHSLLMKDDRTPLQPQCVFSISALKQLVACKLPELQFSILHTLFSSTVLLSCLLGTVFFQPALSDHAHLFMKCVPVCSWRYCFMD